MIRPLIATLVLLASGAAGAAVPIFAAKCPNGLSADSDTKGRIYVNGKLAKVIQRPDGQVTAQSAGVYVDITPRGDQPPRITSTGRDKMVVECEVVSFREPDGAVALHRPLADTRWRLVEFQSMDDARGKTRPHDPAAYTMHLRADGSVQMQLNCNRAQGTWSARPADTPRTWSASGRALACARSANTAARVGPRAGKDSVCRSKARPRLGSCLVSDGGSSTITEPSLGNEGRGARPAVYRAGSRPRGIPAGSRPRGTPGRVPTTRHTRPGPGHAAYRRGGSPRVWRRRGSIHNAN